MIKLTIDGIEVTVEQGATILEAAEKAGVRIPTLCHDKRIIPYGACRMCVVEMEGRPGRLVPACFNPARNGIAVLTHTPNVIEARKLQLQLLLRHHPLDCPVCEAGGACELQNLVYEYAVEDLPFPREAPPFKADRRSHFINRDMNRCILCGRCVRICSEVQGVGELSFTNRGIRTQISPEFDRPLNCEFCGQCVSSCPVGALMNKPLGPIARPWEVKRTTTTCGFCGLGCTLVLETKGGRITQVSSRYERGANQGNLCVKGRYGWPYVHSEQRLTHPLLRKGKRLVEASWEEAIQEIGGRWSAIRQESGPNALAVLGSARLTNEEAYVLQRLARGVLGTAHLDHGAGLSYQALLGGVQPLLGYPASTNQIREIREADVILAICGDFKQTHPVAKNQVVLASDRRGARVIIVDHVHTSFCDKVGAQAIMVRPGTEGLFVRGMIRCILDEDLWDKAFVRERTEGIEDIQKALVPHDLKSVAKATGVTEEQIRGAARAFAQAPSGCILMSMETVSVGDPVDLAQSSVCLAVLVGKIGRRGCGLHILGEKANSQGALDMGLLPGYLPGFWTIDNREHRRIFEEIWDASLPENRGLDTRGILEGCLGGTIRGLYVVGENPVGTYPDRAWVEKALGGVEFLVVQDLFLSDTAQRAHVVLPVGSFAEKDGTYTSVDRRIQRLHKALSSPGGVPSDLEVFGRLAKAMGTSFPYQGPEDVLTEIGSVVNPYRGVSWDAVGDGGIAWPMENGGQTTGTPILYAQGFPNGKASLTLRPWKDMRRARDKKTYPWILHPQTWWFHSGTFSTWSPTLMEVCPGPRILLHRDDARSLDLKDGDRARVVSPHGSLEAPVETRPLGPKGVVQVPHHFPDAALNRLLVWEEKVASVRLEKVKG
jgi:predicted molibdopterin-dependent oxidoreductase YjgC